MKKPELIILCVGKVKELFWQKAMEHYLELLAKAYKLKIHETRDIHGKLQPEEIKRKEGANLIAELPPGFLTVGLWEQGNLYTSMQFAAQLQAWGNRKLCFILGGPHGLANDVLEKCEVLVSLSPMTLPHEMARIVLLEQIYRGTTINHHRPYHH